MRPAPASRFYRAFFDDAGLAAAKAALARLLVSHVPTNEPSTPTAECWLLSLSSGLSSLRERTSFSRIWVAASRGSWD